PGSGLCFHCQGQPRIQEQSRPCYLHGGRTNGASNAHVERKEARWPGMVMRQSAVVELAQDLLIPGQDTERQRLDTLDKWWRWDPEEITLPSHADREHKALREVSETPWLSLVVTTLAQQLVAELVRSSEVD